MIYLVRSSPKPHYKMVLFRDSVPEGRMAFRSVAEAAFAMTHKVDLLERCDGLTVWRGVVAPTWTDRLLARWFGEK